MLKSIGTWVLAFVLLFNYQAASAKTLMPDAPISQLRGVNKAHWDQTSAGIFISGANVIRFGINFNKPASANLAMIRTTPRGITPIVGSWAATCKQDADSLSAVVDTWVAQAPVWTRMDGIVNIANEWGPIYPDPQQVKPSTKLLQHGWRDAYIAAIARMRSAGYRGTLMIDAGGCGQDWRAIVNDGADVLAADPLHKIVFDLHIYGGLNTDIKLDKAFAALVASKLPVFIGEFGPGNMIGPSKTPITPENIIARAESAHFGWAAWAWDDNDLGGCKSDDAWFSMTRFCSRYTGLADDLTIFGQKIVAILHTLNHK
jgi:hypothetical protein